MLSTRINTNLTDESIKNNEEGRTGVMKQLGDVQKDKFQLARKNTIKTLLIVGVGFVVCWVQNQVTFLMYNIGYNIDFNGIYHQYTILMGFLNCTINPFTYLVQYKDYQTALKSFLHCKKSDDNRKLSRQVNHVKVNTLEVSPNPQSS